MHQRPRLDPFSYRAPDRIVQALRTFSKRVNGGPARAAAAADAGPWPVAVNLASRCATGAHSALGGFTARKVVVLFRRASARHELSSAASWLPGSGAWGAPPVAL